MNKDLKFIEDICLTDCLSHEAKVERTYAVIMYLLNIQKSISSRDAEIVMDMVKSGNYEVSKIYEFNKWGK